MAGTDGSYYDVLQVALNAEPEVIAFAYKALARKYHPDQNNGILESEKRMVLINHAYSVLSDPQKRAQYDARLKAAEKAERAEAERRAAEKAERAEAERRAAEKAERAEAERRAAEKAERVTSVRCEGCGTVNRVAALVEWNVSVKCGQCGQALRKGEPRPPVLSPGTFLLKSQYRIRHMVGHGGMSVVYAADDLGRPGGQGVLVAVKQMVMPSTLSVELRQKAVFQFRREAEVLASLRHSNLPTVHRLFEDNGDQFMVMDWVEGQTLHDIVTVRHVDVSTVVGWGIQVCETLVYLHSCKPYPVVHKDLKPSNLMLLPNGRVVLIDFGIAKALDPQGTYTVAKGAGTPGFRAPEACVTDSQTDPLVDQYGLGATMFALLFGSTPPDSLDRQKAVVDGQQDPLANLLSIGTSYPGDLRAVIGKMMALRKSERFIDSTEALHAIRSAKARTDGSGGGHEKTVHKTTNRDTQNNTESSAIPTSLHNNGIFDSIYDYGCPTWIPSFAAVVAISMVIAGLLGVLAVVAMRASGLRPYFSPDLNTSFTDDFIGMFLLALLVAFAGVSCVVVKK